MHCVECLENPFEFDELLGGVAPLSHFHRVPPTVGMFPYRQAFFPCAFRRRSSSRRSASASFTTRNGSSATIAETAVLSWRLQETRFLECGRLSCLMARWPPNVFASSSTAPEGMTCAHRMQIR